MRELVQAIIALSASPGGVFLLALLDSTVFLALPFGIDLAVIGLAAQNGPWVWAVPLLAVMGSAAGAASTYWMGTKIGEQGLERFASPRGLTRMRKRMKHSSAWMLTLFQLMPPPFPLTLLVLAAGALKVRPSVFFTTFAACRLARFGLETVLAVMYGQRIAAWLTSDMVTDSVKWLIGLCAVATLFTLARWLRTPRTGMPEVAA
jgi:membrane protein YqaA with SNARE-associated domain